MIRCGAATTARLPRGSTPTSVTCTGARAVTFVESDARAVAAIKLGLQQKLYLGNLDSRRDWGHARDYVVAMWSMLQQRMPEDFVIASGHQYSVRQFIEAACSELDIAITWRGEGERESGVDRSGKCIVAVDPRYFRPTEVETLLGDPTKAKKKLGWEPHISFKELVSEMVREDFKAAQRDALVKSHGHRSYDHHE